MPCGFRWPMVNAAVFPNAPARIGLSSGIVPSGLTRSTFPLSELGFCAKAVFPASPIVTQSLPSGAKTDAAAVVVAAREHPRADDVAIEHQRAVHIAIAQHLV